jgi:magnesium transporter
MPRTIPRRSAKIGLPPGALIHVGQRHAQEANITLCQYDEGHFAERRLVPPLEITPPPPDARTVTWLHIDGLHDISLLEGVGSLFGLHPLILEDILNTEQRPKLEDHGDYLFIVLKRFHESPDGALEPEQISLVLGPNWLISLQEKAGSLLTPIRERLRTDKGRLRGAGTDALAHALLDGIVDSYFSVLEGLGERIETTEEALIGRPEPKTLRAIQNLKREMIRLRKSVWPVREMIGSLSRSGSPLIRESALIYFRDVHDHAIQVIDTIETYRDMLSGMLDIYLSSISNRMNEIMKVLTVIATVFMPLTFLAGVYGMNFKYMPELAWPWAYFALWGLMILIAVVMLAYFRRKRWL